jgi:hypothetical protein
MRRSRRYSCPLRRAAFTSAEPPVARSCSSRPSKTQIVVWNDDRFEPYAARQFHPPSLSCSPRSRSTASMPSWWKYPARDTTIPLIQVSTSPEKKGLGSLPFHVTFSRTRLTALLASSLAGSSPRSRNSNKVYVVEIHLGE